MEQAWNEKAESATADLVPDCLVGA
jgi:hypothetical protein